MKAIYSILGSGICVAVTLCIIITIPDLCINDSIAYKCPQNDIITLRLHNVTFVVVDALLSPQTNMRVVITDRFYNSTCVFCSYTYKEKTTGIDGSCSFILDGRSEYTIGIYNEILECEKEFVVYPIQSCYLIVTG